VIFSANILSAALQSCPTIKCVCLYADPSANLLTSGPYGLIFASFVPFYFDIPVSTRFHIFSNHFSDKSFIYLAGVQVKENTCTFLCVNVFAFSPRFGFGFSFCHICPFVSLSNTRDPISVLVLQLLLSSWKRSILPGICGILAGSLYRLNIFGIRKAKVGFLASPHIFCN